MGTGRLSPNDLMNALRIFGYNAQRKVIYHIMSEIDKSESGKIQFEEFLKIMIDNLRPCDSDRQEDYERVFSQFLEEDESRVSSEAFRKKGSKSLFCVFYFLNRN